MSCFLVRNSKQLDQASNCLVMGQVSWPKSSRKGIGVYNPTVWQCSNRPSKVVGRSVHPRVEKDGARGPLT